MMMRTLNSIVNGSVQTKMCILCIETSAASETSALHGNLVDHVDPMAYGVQRPVCDTSHCGTNGRRDPKRRVPKLMSDYRLQTTGVNPWSSFQATENPVFVLRSLWSYSWTDHRQACRIGYLLNGSILRRSVLSQRPSPFRENVGSSPDGVSEGR